MVHTPPNYTQIPNIFFEEIMPHLTLVETRVLLSIYRQTFGWHKDKDRISLSQLQEMTGSSRTNINSAIDSLEMKGLIIKEVTGENGDQKTYYEVCFKEIFTSDKLSPPPSDKLSLTKELEENKEEKLVTQAPQEPSTSSPELRSKIQELPLSIQDPVSKEWRIEHFTKKEAEWLCSNYSEEIIRKSYKNIVNRKKSKNVRFSVILNDKAYFLDNLKKVKNGLYK